MEAKKAETDMADASLDAAILRCGTDVSATVVSPTQKTVDEEVVAEKAVAEKQTVLKLSSVVSQINAGRKGDKFKQG